MATNPPAPSASAIAPSENGLLKLVLGLAEFLHELMERQALRRMEDGSLSDGEIEGLGGALQAQSEELARLRASYGFDKEDINLDLGPLGKLFTQ